MDTTRKTGTPAPRCEQGRPRPLGHSWPLALLALAVLGAGCMKAQLSDTRLAPTGLTPEEALTVLLEQPAGAEYSARLEKKVARCIRNALRDTHPAVRMIWPAEFRQVALAAVTPDEMSPGEDWSWGQLAGDPAFQARIAPLGLRYLIAVTVGEGKGPKISDRWFAEGGGSGPGPVPTWFGAFWVKWERWASMEAEVVDLMHARVAGTVWASATGKSSAGLAILGIIPVPFVKPSFPPKGYACRELGEGVAQFLAGENAPKDIAAEQFEEGYED